MRFYSVILEKSQEATILTTATWLLRSRSRPSPRVSGGPASLKSVTTWKLRMTVGNWLPTRSQTMIRFAFPVALLVQHVAHYSLPFCPQVAAGRRLVRLRPVRHWPVPPLLPPFPTGALSTLPWYQEASCLQLLLTLSPCLRRGSQSQVCWRLSDRSFWLLPRVHWTLGASHRVRVSRWPGATAATSSD